MPEQLEDLTIEAIIDTKPVLPGFLHRACGCVCRHWPDSWAMCSYHQGFDAGVKAAKKAHGQFTEES